jgi:hypothetical protein
MMQDTFANDDENWDAIYPSDLARASIMRAISLMAGRTACRKGNNLKIAPAGVE